jgi:hypothetical protein
MSKCGLLFVAVIAALSLKTPGLIVLAAAADDAAASGNGGQGITTATGLPLPRIEAPCSACRSVAFALQDKLAQEPVRERWQLAMDPWSARVGKICRLWSKGQKAPLIVKC